MDSSDRNNFAGDGVSEMEDVIRRPNNPVPAESDSESDTLEQRELETTDSQSVNPTNKSVSKKKCTLTVQEAISKKKGETDSGTDQGIECSVCLQPCIHPVQLPCKHIFCFLCVKGAANRSKRCALCRQEMPQDFFQNPRLVREEDLEQTVRFDEEFQWFYEGRNGWWQYDDRTSQEIEVKFKEGDKTFELLIAGFLYVIDLENMVQFRRNDRTRKRKIKRDRTSSPDIKGIAGLKYPHQVSTRPGGDGGESAQVTPPVISPPIIDQNHDDNLLTSPPAPNNTPQTPQTPADSPPSSVSNSHQDLSAHFQHLNLADHSPSSDHTRTNSGHVSTHFPVLYSNSDEES